MVTDGVSYSSLVHVDGDDFDDDGGCGSLVLIIEV